MYGKLYIDEFTDERYDHLFIDDKITDIMTDDDESEDEDEYDPAYDAGKDFMDNFLTGDSISLGQKWFNLPDFTELNKQFVERFNIGKTKYISSPVLTKLDEEYIINIEE